jgi:phosphoribosylamine--glycine ligase
MGAYSPAPVMTPALIDQTMREIIEPTMRGMAAIGAPFTGVLYAGLMIDESGPKLIEYNVRFGDPECQVLMMRLKDDILVLLKAAAEGELAHVSARWKDDAALTVVMAAEGYPGTPIKGTAISGLGAAEAGGAKVFHVLNVTAQGADVTAAQAKAYEAVDAIDWPGGFCRRDIGWRAVEREAKN